MFSLLKLPLVNPNDSPANQADVVHHGIQEGTTEGLFYSGVFIEKIDKEINESGASQASLRENIRVRKMQKEIVEIQSEIDKVDMEEIARSRRAFKDQYKPAKEKETELQGQVSGANVVLWMLADRNSTLTSAAC